MAAMIQELRLVPAQAWSMRSSSTRERRTVKVLDDRRSSLTVHLFGYCSFGTSVGTRRHHRQPMGRRGRPCLTVLRRRRTVGPSGSS